MNIKILKDSSSFKTLLAIFGTSEYLETKSKEYGWFVSDNFILPFYIDRRAIFSKLVFTTNIVVLESKDKKEFLNQIIVKAKELNIDLISQPLANVIFTTIPNNCKSTKWGSYIVDLTISENEIMKNIHSKHRNVIKKAIKDGVSIEETRDVELIYNNIKETMQRQNRAYPSIYDLNKIKSFSSFFIAIKDDIIQGCSVIPFNTLGAMYLYGGSISRPYTGSLNLMHYQAMLILKDKGVLQYDFMGARPNVEVGSKLEGIQRFKSRFGGELQQGYLWKYEYKPIKVKIINFIQRIRFKLKNSIYLGDAIDQESNK